MKKSSILFSIIFIVFLSSYPAQAGYYKLSGDGWIQWDRTGASAEGSEPSKFNSLDINHVDMSATNIQGKTSRVIYTWDTPPQIIRQDEVVPVSLSYIFTGPQYEGCGVSWGGTTLINFHIGNDNPPEGKITNTVNKILISWPKDGDEVQLVYSCKLGGAFTDVRFLYKWVEDETPTTVTTTTYTPTTALGTGYDNGMGAPGGSVIYSNGNAGGVYNNPTGPTTFTLTNTYNVMSISTYHYNSGSGATPGTISLKDSSGNIIGTWTATGRYGNFYWDVTPNINLGPGTYTVIDSDPSTWAQNSETYNQGMFIVKGTSATASATTPKPEATTTQGTIEDFTVSISPTEMTVNPGEKIQFTLTVEPEGDFNEPVEIYVRTEALGLEKNYGRVKIISPPYKPYVFESTVPDEVPKGTTITGYVTAKGGGLERDAGTVIVNVPGFGMLLAIGALGIVILLRKRR